MAARPELIQSWKQHINRCQNNGQSAAAYCRQQNLSKSAFFYWKRRLGNDSNPALNPSAFVPVKVVPSPLARVEVELACGRVVKFQGDFRPAQLAELVRALEA